jgi:UDP-N-acetylmuramoylalanine--D-glutamate ligase
MSNLAEKTVIVVGLGSSGLAACKLALQQGANVVATDKASEETLSEEVRALGKSGKVKLILGTHDNLPLSEAALIVMSPGVPPLRSIEQAEQRGHKVISELEFGWKALKRMPTGAVGGTNGKSTTTALAGEMLKRSGKRVFVGGNLGVPVSQAALDQAEKNYECAVLEVSSFQAERMPAFRPKVAALLAITPDHLDRYSSIDAYAAAKGNMVANMEGDDVLAIPFNNTFCRREAYRSDAHVVTFGPQGDMIYTNEAIIDKLRELTINRKDIKLIGDHNMENVCAAITIAFALGAREEGIREALATFEGLPHRMRFVDEVDEIPFYNDSKATNVDAAVTALRGLRHDKVVLIAGGRDKLGSYERLVEALKERGRALVLLGEAADRIKDAVGDAVRVMVVETMEEAVAEASSFAQKGDAVLLSPACSSFDMYQDYAERGDAFIEAVVALKPQKKKKKKG